MRIALVHYTRPPVVGGVERVIADQERALRMLGHEVAVIDRERWRSRERYDVVMVHNVFSMPFDLEWTRELTALAEADSGEVWVNWVHDVAALNPAYATQGWIEPVPRALHVAVSEVRAREWAAVAGLAANQVMVVPNGVDPAHVLGFSQRLADCALRHGLWEADLLLLLPARFVRRKNIELGIEVLAALKEQGVRARLMVTGAPDPHQADGQRYFEELQMQVHRLAVETEIVWAGMAGTLDDGEVRALYQCADALFFPSRSEGFGLPLREAMLHRLPVWCADIEAHREVAGEGACFFDPTEAPAKLAGRLREWLAGQPTIAERHRLWREKSWLCLCKERLVPWLQAAIKRP